MDNGFFHHSMSQPCLYLPAGQHIHHGLTDDEKIARTMNICAQHYGLSKGEMLQRCRRQHVVECRQMAMLLIRNAHPDKTLEQIGSLFGLNHTTVLYGIRNMEHLVKYDDEIRARYENIRNKVKIVC